MATLANLIQIPSLLNQDTVGTNIPNSAALPRIAVSSTVTSGGSSDPIGPQRWPVKL